MPQQPVIPVALPLGKAIPVPGKPHTWVIQKRAVQGSRYLMICPECGAAANRTMENVGTRSRTCPKCQSVTYYKVIAAPQPTPENNDNQSAETSQAQAAPPKKPTETFKVKGLSSAELTWGKLFRTKHYRLSAGITTLGREDSAEPSDVSLSDLYVSRRSAQIEATKASGGFNYKFTVLNATNPVLVNDKELRPGTAIYLNFGDTITMGRTRLTFKKSQK